MTASRPVQRADDPSLRLTDRVLIAIQSYNVEEPHFSLDEIAAKTHLTKNQVYSAMYRMNDALEVLTEPIPGTGTKKIYGARLKGQLPPPRRVAALATVGARVTPIERIPAPATRAYIAQREAVEDARRILRDAGMDADTAVQFSLQPLGEEAATLLEMVNEARRANNKLIAQLEAANRDLQTYREREESGRDIERPARAAEETPAEVMA